MNRIDDRLKQIDLAGKANGSHSKTITRMQDEYCRAMAGKSRVMAIKTFCPECMGWEKPLASAIRACTDQGIARFTHTGLSETLAQPIQMPRSVL